MNGKTIYDSFSVNQVYIKHLQNVNYSVHVLMRFTFWCWNYVNTMAADAPGSLRRQDTSSHGIGYAT